jgi:hypothetical protein
MSQKSRRIAEKPQWDLFCSDVQADGVEKCPDLVVMQIAIK